MAKFIFGLILYVALIGNVVETSAENKRIADMFHTEIQMHFGDSVSITPNREAEKSPAPFLPEFPDAQYEFLQEIIEAPVAGSFIPVRLQLDIFKFESDRIASKLFDDIEGTWSRTVADKKVLRTMQGVHAENMVIFFSSDDVMNDSVQKFFVALGKRR